MADIPIIAKATVEIPATHPLCKDRTQLGEGAVWHNDRLLWIDIVKGKIFTYNPSKPHDQAHTKADVRQVIGTIVPTGNDETVIAAMSRGVCEVNLSTGRLVRFLGQREGELPENRWNDGKCDSQGRLWVGSMNAFCGAPSGSLWSVTQSGEWQHHVEGVTVSNGLVWSKDSKTFWYIDTPTLRIDAFDFDVEAGTISNRRPAVAFEDSNGYPDGCTIDSEDMIWVAMWEGSAVLRVDPVAGRILGKVEIPGANQVTSCAFGGRNLDQLFVTTASCGISAEQLDSTLVNAGAVFRIDCSALGVTGVVAPRFGVGI